MEEKELFKLLFRLLPNESFLVGGLVRDYLLGKESSDIDITLKGKPQFYASLLAKELGGHLFGFKKENLPFRDEVYSVVLPLQGKRIRIDLSSFNSLGEDLRNRDFTINALAWKLEDFLKGKKNIVDPFGGVEDLKNRLIRPVAFKNVLDDPLRMLRAYRFSQGLNFKLEPSLRSFIKQNAPLIKKVAPERILQEILKALSYPNSSRFILDTYRDHLLNQIFPLDREALLNAATGLEKLENLLRSPLSNLLQRDLEQKKRTFLGEFGEDTAIKLLLLYRNSPSREKFLSCLPFGKELKKYLKEGLDCYEKIKGLELSDIGQLYLYLKKCEPYLYAVSLLSHLFGEEAKFKKLLEFYENRYKPLGKPLLNGKEVMELLSLKPSPKVGKILERLILAQLKGQVKTKQDAKKFIKNLHDL